MKICRSPFKMGRCVVGQKMSAEVAEHQSFICKLGEIAAAHAQLHLRRNSLNEQNLRRETRDSTTQFLTQTKTCVHRGFAGNG